MNFVATGPELDCYELDMANDSDSAKNQIVVAERPKDPALSISRWAAATTVKTSDNLELSYKA